MSGLVNIINDLLEVDIIRYFLVVLTSVMAGYTLQPVPSVLNNLFDNSQLFKFLILFLVGCAAFYPLDDKKLTKLIIAVFIVLLLFEVIRNKA
jgi:hypothetical protein